MRVLQTRQQLHFPIELPHERLTLVRCEASHHHLLDGHQFVAQRPIRREIDGRHPALPQGLLDLIAPLQLYARVQKGHSGAFSEAPTSGLL